MTKIISSATDSSANAVCSSGESPSSALQRARTMELSDGMDAPASPPVISRAQKGARVSAQPMSAATAAAKNTASGRSTRRCPNRSASRAACGAQAAYPTEPAAATNPASPYRPVTDAISRTVPRPNMDIGIRPRKPAAENASAPGLASTSRNGLPCRWPRSLTCVTLPATSALNLSQARPRLLGSPAAPAGSWALRPAQRPQTGLGWIAMMGRLIGRLLVRWAGSRATASGSRTLALRGVAGCSALVLLGTGAYAGILQPAPGGSGSTPALSAAAAAREAASFGQIILPDLLIVAPSGLTSRQLARLSKITGVRNMIAFDGAEIKAGNQPVSVIGVNPSQFRPWVPLQTASDQPFW